MKIPAAPPDFTSLLEDTPASQMAKSVQAVGGQAMSADYLAWDRLRFKDPPAGLTRDEWWLGLKIARRAARREIPPLVDVEGAAFSFTLPDQLLRAIDKINTRASGDIAIGEDVTNAGTRDRYIVSGLIEEAITSSQLEGATTTRRVARDMLRTGRPPKNHSERMIINNFRAMQRIVAFQGEPMTPERVCEIHRIVTAGTLDDPADAGRPQSDQGERIAVHDDQSRLLHNPPPAAELTQRLERLCVFANGDADSEDYYLPPVLRAIAVHFMVGYDHYFVDGNGRTARALFYWCMLRQGYWLTEFLTISTILKQGRASYGRSFLLTEQDEGDLTHFFIFHCGVIIRSVQALDDYLGRKARELRDLQTRMSGRIGEFNHRQIAVIEHAVKNPAASFTATNHAASHRVTTQTARQDLGDLERRGFLNKTMAGRRQIWSAAPDLASRLD